MSSEPPIDGRLARLEATVENLAESVRGLVGSVKTINEQVAVAGRPTISTVLACAGMIVGLWGFAIRPKETEIAALQADRDRQRERADQQANALTMLVGKVAQLATFQNYTNQTHSRIESLLWAKVYGQELPPAPYSPEVNP